MHDLELLRQYSREGSQAAFAALVARYVDMVYSSARRQVWSPQLAEEITQAVFLDLARQADKLRPDSHLGSWLYVVARRTSVDVIRRESRRQKREQIGWEGAALIAPSSTWSRVAPLLDEAISSLNEADRRAILLRFFEKKSLNDVGQTMGTSEETAQRRVSRAVERLREFLIRRGVATSAAALAAEIAPHAVQAAPTGLAASISTGLTLAQPAVQSATLLKSAQILAMTFAQKAAITAVIAAAVAGGLFQNSIIRAQTRQIADLAKQADSWQQQIRLLNRERSAAARAIQVTAVQQGLKARLAAKIAASQPAASDGFPNDFLQQHKLVQAKMAEMKPLLEAGTPIKGSAILYIGGKAVDQPIEFVIGKETRIEGDDGTYTVTPALNQDGSVKYPFRLVKPSLTEDGTVHQEEINIMVTETPWEDFQIATRALTGDTNTLAFVPDQTGPSTTSPIGTP